MLSRGLQFNVVQFNTRNNARNNFRTAIKEIFSTRVETKFSNRSFDRIILVNLRLELKFLSGSEVRRRLPRIETVLRVFIQRWNVRERSVRVRRWILLHTRAMSQVLRCVFIYILERLTRVNRVELLSRTNENNLSQNCRGNVRTTRTATCTATFKRQNATTRKSATALLNITRGSTEVVVRLPKVDEISKAIKRH